MIHLSNVYKSISFSVKRSDILMDDDCPHEKALRATCKVACHQYSQYISIRLTSLTVGVVGAKKRKLGIAVGNMVNPRTAEQQVVDQVVSSSFFIPRNAEEETIYNNMHLNSIKANSNSRLDSVPEARGTLAKASAFAVNLSGLDFLS
ncbi:hypothetical protein WAI453_009003 [Rhynchosporium graminicola]